ncbi:MAG TPA: FtsK/SpoIIIE domain-containing protein, partial [Acidothermaceae bacterium]|nr:FtsK/SpoIIIE domain-containing protein [Acidothermaceae bacterium]
MSRSPVVRAGPASPPTITFPELPPESPPQRLPLLATLAPLLGGVAMAAFLRRWEFLAFALMSPLVVVGQALSDRWHRRRSARRQRKDYDEHFAQSVVALEHALDEERRRRREESPDLDSVVTATRDRTALLWSRPATESETALTLRVGVGKVAADVVVQGGPNTAVVDDVPVLLRLGPGDVVGVCGADAAGAARALLVQAVTLNGPAAVSVSVIAPGRAREWSWTRWLPHTRTSDGGASVAFDAHGLSTLVRPGNRPGPRLVLVTGQADHAVVAKLTRESRATVVWVADDERQLPGSCNSILRTGTEQGGEGLLRTCDGTTRVQVESVTTGIADTVARSLAPLRDASPEASVELPTQVAWSELAELPLHDRDATLAAMCRRWAQPPTTEVTLGVGTGGIAVQVDLARHGPHALVAGTTGSGKSELLQSLVAGLVVGCSPADLSFLLLDYKGGATFGPFQRLPHTLAVLTDLDAAATTRVLRSLNAELRRRERIFATAGVADFDSLQRHRRQQIGSVASLARLVIVVDEFAALIEELPDFVGGLVGIAQRGRSLGVHLILATQRPEGAVSPDIRANTRLGICLAVTRESESRDVIDSPVAVTIQPTTPGRAWLRMDGQGLIEVQTARINCPTSTDDEPRLVSLWEWADPRAPMAPAEAGSQLEALIDAAVQAASSSGLPATPSP